MPAGKKPEVPKKIGKLVLVADDHRNIRNIVCFTLEKEGFGTVQASDGQGALFALLSNKVDLILLDSAMPRIDGLEVCRTLKKDPKTRDIPIIFSTGRTDKQHVLDAIQAGAADYIVKPFAPDVLVNKVRKVLGLPVEPREKDEPRHG
ncbi:MAG: response regulator [Planctomycetes bacterium]|nr:response regulator [Planctomycetota bacterium]